MQCCLLLLTLTTAVAPRNLTSGRLNCTRDGNGPTVPMALFSLENCL
ncbi:hypothetical protein Ptr902_04743 [Pyrenophora tritici-repentis]|nr:hypothetical protein Ptr902_04743 [Pyrenophora tritici-repentis]